MYATDLGSCTAKKEAMHTETRPTSFSLAATARWLAQHLTVLSLMLLLSACSSQGGIGGAIGTFNKMALDAVTALWGTVFVAWIAGLAFWLIAYGIQGYWEAPWQKVSGWGKPALIYGGIGQVVMGVLYGLAVANLNGYSGQ